MNKCKNCSKVIESKGTKPKQFCSDACRKKWNRTQLQEQASKRTLQADELANGHEQTDKPVTEQVIEFNSEEKPDNYGAPDCTCKHCQANRSSGSKHILNHGAYKPVSELAPNELNRVSLPGDVDYEGHCVRDAAGVCLPIGQA